MNATDQTYYDPRVGIPARQSGTALALSLLILLLMTIVGVATMSSIHMQERMAGNVNTQTLAFEAASAGISEALDFGIRQWNENECSREQGSWAESAWSDYHSLDLPAGTAQSVSLQFRLRADCLEIPGFVADSDDLTFDPPVQMFVTSVGEVTVNNERVASREIEVRIDDFRTDGLSAIRIEGEPEVIFGAATSNRFTAEGHGGPAISATTRDNAGKIAGEIGESRIGNYSGGVASSRYRPPFNQADTIRAFAMRIRAFMEEVHQLHEIDGMSPQPYPASECVSTLQALEEEEDFQYEKGLLETYYAFLKSKNAGAVSGTSNFNSWDLMRLVYDSNPNRQRYYPPGQKMGSSNLFDDFYGIHYVADDLVMKGNPTGGGIVIVEGDVDWRGTAEFKGLVLATGGRFEMSGGGQGHTEGMLFATDVALPFFHGEYDKIKTYGVDPALSTLRPLLDGTSGLATSVLMDWTIRESDFYIPMDFFTLDFGSDHFLPTTADFSGGGGHFFEYDCNLMDAQRVVLKCLGLDGWRDGDDETSTFDFWWQSQQCNTPGRGGAVQSIRSWRENLGWREFVGNG